MKENIHVLHLIGSTGLYGAERWILALMRATQRLNLKSTLVNLVDDASELSAIVQSAQKLGLTAHDHFTGGNFNIWGTIRLARWVKDNDADIIHGHGFKSDVFGFITAKLAGKLVMTTPHGWSLEKDLKLSLYEYVDRLLFKQMDMVCPLSEALYSDAIKYSRNNVRLIGNGVDLDQVRSAEPVLLEKQGRFVIGYVGRLVRSKDLLTLLKAVGLLLETGRAVKLVLVGDGDHRQELTETAQSLGLSSDVLFAGFQSEPAGFVSSFDCFVLPSLSEGTPRCVMEAMALKVPVVGSDIPGNRLLISQNETGLLFPVGDSGKLAECVAFIMDHPEASEKIAVAGCSKIEREFSSVRMATEYLDVYQRLTDRQVGVLDASPESKS